MTTYEVMQNLLLAVSIDGTTIDERPVEFSLWTDKSGHGVIAYLLYPFSMDKGSQGDAVVISLADGENETVLFTGFVSALGKIRGAYRKLYLSDDYEKVYGTFITPLYRKEKVSIMLQDTLDAVGISDTAITCPELELARLSLDRVSAAFFLDLLVKVLEEYGFSDMKWFFDSNNVFHFGTFEDTGKNEGEEVSALVGGENILRTGIDLWGRWLEVLPLPLRHSQKITVDGEEMVTIRTEMLVSARHSRLKVWFAQRYYD
jgi:hypothetical protein